MASSESDSGTDDYGYDLTAEEEELLASLVSRASSQPTDLCLSPTASAPVQHHTAAASSQVDPQSVAFDAHTSSNAVCRPHLAHVASEHGYGSTYRNGMDVSSVQAESREEEPSPADPDDGATWAAFVSNANSGPAMDPSEGSIQVDCLDSSVPLEAVRDESAAGLGAPPGQEEGSLDQESRPPLQRFRTYPKKPFSVSDLTAGAWCELQYYYTLTRLPGGKKTRTAAMRGGSKVHKQLEEEVHTTVKVDIAKREDAFGLKLWNIVQGLRTLRLTGITRELEIWGLVDGQLVNGVIDGLTYRPPNLDLEKEGGSKLGHQPASKGGRITSFFVGSEGEERSRIHLFDVKTRLSRTLPSGAAVRPTKIQLFLYHRFLSEMAAGDLDFDHIFSRYALDPDGQFSDTFLAQVGALHEEMFDGDTAITASSQSSATSDDFSAASDATAAPPDLVRYSTIRQLLALLQSELRQTFPHGAASLGRVASVEYRTRARPRGDGDDDSDGDAGGEVIGENVFTVDNAALDRYLAEDMQWWRGEREPRGVVIEEAFKCRSCEFADNCSWRKSEEAELLKKARSKVVRKRQ